MSGVLKMIPGLVHRWAWASDDGAFFQAIDVAGGWPVGYQYVGFEHTDERAAGFCNSRQNTGWWTTLNSADDYYLWKLSPKALDNLISAVVSAIRLPPPTASALWIKNSEGGRAAISKQNSAKP